MRNAVGALEDAQRARWLHSQLNGLAAVAQRLAGRPLTYKDEVRRCYGVDIATTPDDELEELHRQLGRLLPGSGPLPERYEAWHRATEIPRDDLLKALEPVRQEVRRRTLSLFGLPEGESADIELVSNEPWSGFNYYQGGLRSRVAVNTDNPVRASFVPGLLAHEVYPGHHTEHCWKEELLVRGQGYLEESISMIGTPQCLVTEGIASFALDALGPDAEPACEALLRSMGHPYDVELARAVREIRRGLAAALDNAALMLHEEGADVETVRRYLRRWVLESDARLEKNLQFMMHPVWRTYRVVYEAGERIVARWTAGDPARFGRLLTEQLTPPDLTANPG